MKNERKNKTYISDLILWTEFHRSEREFRLQHTENHLRESRREQSRGREQSRDELNIVTRLLKKKRKNNTSVVHTYGMKRQISVPLSEETSY